MSNSSFNFSPKTASILKSFGWLPARRIDIGIAKEKLESSGHVVHSEAVRVLEAFDGLELRDTAGRPMRIDGRAAAAFFERDELPYLLALFPSYLCPVGSLAGMIYLVAEDGRWVALHEGWTVLYVLSGADDAFLFALSDKLPGFVRRELNDKEIPPGYQ